MSIEKSSDGYIEQLIKLSKKSLRVQVIIWGIVALIDLTAIIAIFYFASR